MLKKEYILFHCSKDGEWIISVKDTERDLYLGVADCPDEKTARAVLKAIRERETRKLTIKECGD